MLTIRGSMSIWTPRAWPSSGRNSDIGETRSDHKERVALDHHLIARPRAEQTDRPRDERQIIRQCSLAEQRLGNTGAELVGGLDDLVSGVSAPAPTRIATFFLVEHPGGAFEIFLCRCYFGCLISNRR